MLGFNKKVWIIIDDIAGNANQAIAVAKALNYPYEIRTLKYTFWSFLPNWLKFRFTGIDLDRSSDLEEPFPDIIISSGRKTASVSAYLKKKNPNIFVAHLMGPDMCFSNFDLVCLPHHDKSFLNSRYNNVIYTIGAPCYQDQDLIQKKVSNFSKKLAGFNKPFVSLMIGGKTKSGDYSIDELEDIVKQAINLTANIKGCLFITTSRRTSIKFLAESLTNCTIPYFFFDWQMSDLAENPYLAYLQMSDYFIITGDSVSICSDVLSTGKPTYIYRKNELLSAKHQKFLDYLASLGYIRYLNKDTSMLDHWEYPSLEEAKKISSIIKEKL